MYEIHELRQIRALASPMRQAIIDALETMGPCSALELGDVLGRSSDRLYYHLQILKRSGLVRSRRERNRLGRLQERFDLPGRPTRLRYEPSDPRNVTAVARVVGSALRDAHRSFRRAFVPGVVVRGRKRTLWAGRRTGWLGAREIREINALVGKVIEILECPRKGRSAERLYSFTFAFSPYGRARTARATRGDARG
ncbi:MAG TPA: helix-turn-helix domain-containing protein [Candidatus Eisenbacteria bacterium]|nr:helix-turn-helix domain-containing protein [Candidatus Eisenbacteria bacterium]